MNEVVDRVPSQPGRYKMTMPDGSTQYVTLERADEPTMVGTPLNKALFDSIQNDLDELNSKIIKRVSSDDNNVTSISVNVSSLQTSQYSRFFVVTVGRWNGSDTFSAIGTYKYSGVTSEIGASVLQSNIPGMSIDLTAGGILTASWTSSWSYVQIVAFDHFAPI